MNQVKAMSKVNEITANPFAYFAAKTEAPLYSDVIGTISAASLDVMFNALYGERIVFDNFIKDSALNESVLDVIWLEYADRWQDIREYLALDFSPIDPYHETETYSRNYESKNDGTSTDDDTNNVAGFDSESPVVDTTQQGKTQTTDNRTDTESYTRTKTGSIGNVNQSDLISSALELRKQKFVDILLNDVSGALTLQVYE